MPRITNTGPTKTPTDFLIMAGPRMLHAAWNGYLAYGAIVDAITLSKTKSHHDLKRAFEHKACHINTLCASHNRPIYCVYM